MNKVHYYFITCSIVYVDILVVYIIKEYTCNYLIGVMLIVIVLE